MIWCSGNRYTALSFDGMRIDYEGPRSPSAELKQLDVHYRGRSVFKTSNMYMAEPIDAPGTTGNVCIAKMGDRGSPVALTDGFAGAEGRTGVQVVYPVSSTRYAVRTFYFPGVPPFDIRLLHGSLALVGGDTRFSFLFTSGAGGNSPIVIDRFEGGRPPRSQHPPAVVSDRPGLGLCRGAGVLGRRRMSPREGTAGVAICRATGDSRALPRLYGPIRAPLHPSTEG